MLIDLVEDVVAEKLHDVLVPRFRPSGVPGELRSFVDKPKFAQKPNETPILQLAHELTFKSIDSTEWKRNDKPKIDAKNRTVDLLTSRFPQVP